MSLAQVSIRSYKWRSKEGASANSRTSFRGQSRRHKYSHSTQIATLPTTRYFSVIRCPNCGNDLVYSPIPPLFLCLERMAGDVITINIRCKPWISENASAKDLLRMTDRIENLAPRLIS